MNQTTARTITAIIGILLLAGVGFFATKYFNVKSEKEQLEISADSLNAEIDGLEQKITEFEQTLSNKNLELEEKDKIIQEKTQELNSLMAKLDKIKASGKADVSKIKQLETKMSDMQNMLVAYREEIELLKTENAKLTQSVDSLKVSETTLKKAEVVLKEQAATQQAQIEKQTKLIEEKQQTLTNVISTASVLKVADFKFYNVRNEEKEKEKEGTTFSRMWLKDVKICYHVMENSVAKAGPRDFYLVWEMPDGAVRTSAAAGTFTLNGKEKPYTAKQTINYDQSKQQVCLSIPKDKKSQPYQKGLQTISVYSGGDLIGISSFKID